MDFTRTEAERVRGELKNAEQLIEHHRHEAGELISRYRLITGELQHLQQSRDVQSQDKLVVAFDAALEAQRQLLAARGRLEKMESARDILELYARHLEAVLSGFGEILPRLLHDEVAPPLTNCSLQIEIIQRLLDRNPDQARNELQDLKATTATAIERIRGLMTDLRTPKIG